MIDDFFNFPFLLTFDYVRGWLWEVFPIFKGFLVGCKVGDVEDRVNGFSPVFW